jgi:hypothetical protein
MGGGWDWGRRGGRELGGIGSEEVGGGVGRGLKGSEKGSGIREYKRREVGWGWGGEAEGQDTGWEKFIGVGGGVGHGGVEVK